MRATEDEDRREKDCFIEPLVHSSEETRGRLKKISESLPQRCVSSCGDFDRCDQRLFILKTSIGTHATDQERKEETKQLSSLSVSRCV